MKKQDYIDRINHLLRGTRATIDDVLKDGDESEIAMLIDETRILYAFVRKETERVVRERRLKSITVDPDYKPSQRALERTPVSGKGKTKPQTKEEKVRAQFAALGIEGADLEKYLSEKL